MENENIFIVKKNREEKSARDEAERKNADGEENMEIVPAQMISHQDDLNILRYFAIQNFWTVNNQAYRYILLQIA